jgi:ankyrin repeat protein
MRERNQVRSSDDSTPLHIAAFYGQNDTAKELVGIGLLICTFISRPCDLAWVVVYTSHRSLCAAIFTRDENRHVLQPAQPIDTQLQRDFLKNVSVAGLGASLTSVNSHNQNALQLAEMGKWVGCVALVCVLFHGERYQKID